LRDLPGTLWLLAVPVLAPWWNALPEPRWLLVHVLLLGAASHSILVWSRHFTLAVLHAAPPDSERRQQSARLLLLNGGALLVMTGVLGEWWPVTVLGATGVAAAAAWHGVALVQLLRAALPARFGTTVRYYVAAAGLLPVGALLGVLMAREDEGPAQPRMLVAHVVVNVLGWVGLTVVGTLVTLWPTMLRTRIADGAERASRRALPVLGCAVLTSMAAALLGSRVLTGLGLAGYLAGLVVAARPFAATARRRHPSSYPTWSVLAGTLWYAGCVAVLAVRLGTARSWPAAEDRLFAVTPFLAAGFLAQVLLGALSYLVPSVLGRGPAGVRAGNEVVERAGAGRILVVNASLLVCALPAPRAVRDVAAVLVLAGLASFLPLMLLAVRATRRARIAAAT
jgi:nitrite reductase (NO-forming)